MMRQPGNSRLFCVCKIDWPFAPVFYEVFQTVSKVIEGNGSSRQGGMKTAARCLAVACFTQGSQERVPPGS